MVNHYLSCVIACKIGSEINVSPNGRTYVIFNPLNFQQKHYTEGALCKRDGAAGRIFNVI